MGYRKADPVPDAPAESMVAGVGGGGAGAAALPSHTPTTPGDHAQRGHPVHHPHRRSRRGRRRPAVGAVGQHGDHRHPLARQGHPHPPADAPPKGPHGDAGGGGLPRQPLPGGGGAAHPGQGPHLARRWSWWRTAPRRRSTGRSSRPPWSPWTCTTERSPTSPHKTAHPNEPHHEAPPSLYRETGGASLRLDATPL